MALLGFLSTDLHRLRRFFGASLGFLERQRKFLIFMKFHVFQGFIQIGVGIGIAIGIDHLTTGHFSWFRGFRVSSVAADRSVLPSIPAFGNLMQQKV
jgi:hypothetical protein